MFLESVPTRYGYAIRLRGLLHAGILLLIRRKLANAVATGTELGSGGHVGSGNRSEP